MKALLLLLFLKMVNTQNEISERINAIVFKYKFEFKDNPEFFLVVEELNRVGKTNNSTLMADTLRDFQAYDELRQHLEEKILIRINELESFFPDRSLSEACVDDYIAQKNDLIKFKKMSNAEKRKALHKNSRECSTVDTTQVPPPTNATSISTTTAPGVNMILITSSTEPAVTVTLTGDNTDPGKTSTEPGKTSTGPGKTSTEPGKTSTDRVETSTDPGKTLISIGESTDLRTMMPSKPTTTSPGVTNDAPTRINGPYEPIINHCRKV